MTNTVSTGSKQPKEFLHPAVALRPRDTSDRHLINLALSNTVILMTLSMICLVAWVAEREPDELVTVPQRNPMISLIFVLLRFNDCVRIWG